MRAAPGPTAAAPLGSAPLPYPPSASLISNSDCMQISGLSYRGKAGDTAFLPDRCFGGGGGRGREREGEISPPSSPPPPPPLGIFLPASLSLSLSLSFLLFTSWNKSSPSLRARPDPLCAAGTRGAAGDGGVGGGRDPGVRFGAGIGPGRVGELPRTGAATPGGGGQRGAYRNGGGNHERGSRAPHLLVQGEGFCGVGGRVVEGVCPSSSPPPPNPSDEARGKTLGSFACGSMWFLLSK